MSNIGKKSKWNLSVYITNLSTEKSVEVNGETHVGKLMLDLVEGLGKCLQRNDDSTSVIQYRNLLYGCGTKVVFKSQGFGRKDEMEAFLAFICTLRCCCH